MSEVQAESTDRIEVWIVIAEQVVGGEGAQHEGGGSHHAGGGVTVRGAEDLAAEPRGRVDGRVPDRVDGDIG